MSSDEVMAKLRGQRDRLAGFGVSSLYVFGSAARGDARPDSDIDMLVDFNGPATFDRYTELRFYLEDLLQHSIDLVTRQAVRPELQAAIERDARRVA